MSSIPLAYSDSESIDSLLHADKPDGPRYSSKNLEFLTCSNFDSGVSNSFEFDSQPITGKWTTMKEGYLALPTTITPKDAANAPFADLPQLAFKSSILSLIDGCEVRTDTGVTLVKEERGLAFSGHLRLLLEQGSDWYLSNGSGLHWSKDGPMPGVLSGLTTQANIAFPRVNKYTGAPAAADNADNPPYNVGFASRRDDLIGAASLNAKNAAPAAALKNEIYLMLHIPLRYISTWYEANDTPIINSRLFHTFYVNTSTRNSAYKPICRGSLLNPAAQEVEYEVKVMTAPRLYYHSVTFDPATQAKIAEKMLTGFTKKIRYIQSSIVPVSVIAGNGPFQHQLITTVVNPKRVFAMVYPRDPALPQGVVNSDAWPSPVVTGSYGFDSLNILINGSKYFQTDQRTPGEQYLALKDVMHLGIHGDSISPLSYADWLRTHRIHVLDVSRIGTLDVNRNAPVALSVEGSVANAGAVDIVYVIQRERQCQLDFGAADFRVTVGDLLWK